MLLGWEINLVVIWPFMETHYCHYYSHLNLKNATGRKKKEEWTRERYELGNERMVRRRNAQCGGQNGEEEEVGEGQTLFT